MKKNIFAALLFICALCTVSAAEKKIPVLWKNSEKGEYKVRSFGFTQDKDQYYFMVQINSLKKLLENDNAMMSLYLDTDNNSNTGRFAGKKGWDLQLNVHLKRRAVSAVVWKKEQIKTTYTFTNGEFSVKTAEDKLYISLKKVYFLKNISINRRFVLFEEHSCSKDKMEKTLMNGIKINIK